MLPRFPPRLHRNDASNPHQRRTHRAHQQSHKDRGRGEDAVAKQRRLEKAGREIAAAWQHYDHMVVNDDLDQAVREVIAIIQGKLTVQ